MKLATLRTRNHRNRHGELVIVSSDNQFAVRSPESMAKSLLEALENWDEVAPELQKISRDLNQQKKQMSGAFAFRFEDCLAPLPQAPGFYDGSAFLSHVVRARRARGDEMPASARITPLMYQGVSDNLLPYNAPIEFANESFGGDFEGELAVITKDVPKGTPAERLGSYIALISLFNDITLREIVKTELETKFGFLQSKPNSAFAPIVVTPDELGSQWSDGRYLGDISVYMNGELFGHPNGSEMHFSFQQLMAHACRTRPLAAGSIVGSGTISNEDKTRGFACLTEKRFQEVLDLGKPVTPWLVKGDRVKMEVIQNGVSVFGPIDEITVV